MAQQQISDWEVVEESGPSTAVVVDDWEEVPMPSAPAASTPSRRPVATPPATGTAFQDRDLLGELNKTFPGIGLTSGYRDQAYQADMRKRGYKPAARSEHLTGDSVDISSFPGMTLAEGAAELRRQYPNAKILYGDKNHRDHVHFSAPGYGAFPALGGASEAGLSNPAYEGVDEGWEVVEDAGTPTPSVGAAASTQEAPQGPAGVTLVGGLPQGSEIEFNIDKDSNQIFNRDKWLMEELGFTSNAEAEYVAWLNANRGNKNITSKDVQAVFERLAPSHPQPKDVYEESAELLREGKVGFGAFDSSPAEEAYRAELQKAAEEGDTGSQGNYAALVGQGLTANLADEAEGLLAGAGAALRGEDASEAYTQARNVERLKVEQAREQEGALGTVAEIAASVPTSFALPFANAKRAADLAKAGAVSGAVYGFGRGDELGGSLGSAAIDAVTGAVAAPALDKVVKKVAGKFGKVVDDVADDAAPVTAKATPLQELYEGDLVKTNAKEFLGTRVGRFDEDALVIDENGKLWRIASTANPAGDHADLGQAIGEEAFDKLVRVRSFGNEVSWDFENLTPRQKVALQELESRSKRLGINTEGDLSDLKELTPVEKLSEALAEAKPLRDAQDTLTKAARAERAAKIRGIQEGNKGESGFFASLSALKGELPKVEAKSIRDKFSQDDVDTLYASIHDVEDFSPFDILNAQRGLTKLLGPEGVGVPTQSELDLLKKVFPEDVVNSIGRLRPAAFKDKLKEGAANALNLPRAIMSTLDLSAPLRQGIFTVRRKEFWKNFNTMFKAFGSEKSYRAVMDDIDSRPTRALMEENGLAVTGLDGPLSKREEDFMSNWAEKIPVFGRGARASNRAYTAFLAKLRADVFDDLLEKMNKLDPEFTNTDSSVKALAGYVNNATGRGGLGGYESAAPLLNSLFFSPRLISSRVQLLNPAYYMSLPAPLRTEALKDLAAFGGVASTVLGLAKASGAEVETDPRSTNFAKIKVGDTRYDILGGFQQYLRLASVIATNSTKTGKGEVKKLGEGFGADTRLSVLGKFARSKLSPVASYLYDALEGKDFLGEPFDPVEGAAERFVPMFIGDLAEAFKEEGLMGVAKTSPGFFGVGVSTYPTPVDDFGNTVEAGGPAASDDPVYQEVEKLGKQSDIIGSPSKKVGRKTLTKEQFEQYKQASGKAIYEQLAREMKQPEWAEMSPQEKKDLIKEVKKEEREAVRNELFPDAAD